MNCAAYKPRQKKRKTKPTSTAKLPHPWALFLTFFLYSPCSCEHLSQLLIEWRQPFKQHLYYSTCAIEKQIIHTENNSILCRISTTFVEFCQRALIFNFTALISPNDSCGTIFFPTTIPTARLTFRFAIDGF